jgi:hypothetical protein
MALAESFYCGKSSKGMWYPMIRWGSVPLNAMTSMKVIWLAKAV